MQYAFASTQTNKVKYPKKPFHRKADSDINFETMNDEDIVEKMNALTNSINSRLGRGGV